MPPRTQLKTSSARIYESDRTSIRALQDAFERRDGHRPTEQQVIRWAIRALQDQRELETGAQP